MGEAPPQLLIITEITEKSGEKVRNFAFPEEWKKRKNGENYYGKSTKLEIRRILAPSDNPALHEALRAPGNMTKPTKSIALLIRAFLGFQTI